MRPRLCLGDGDAGCDAADVDAAVANGLLEEKRLEAGLERENGFGGGSSAAKTGAGGASTRRDSGKSGSRT